MAEKQNNIPETKAYYDNIGGFFFLLGGDEDVVNLILDERRVAGGNPEEVSMEEFNGNV